MARNELQLFGESVLLHDVGKMLVPPEILNKPGKLTPEEFEIMKLHVDRGVDVLQGTFPDRPELAVVAAEHHERYDGSGYPKGLRGSEISQWGQVSAVADVYDALTSERCYKSAMPTVKAVSLIYRLRGGDFNPHCVDKFIECVGIYPIGTLVRLNTREIGVVTSVRHEDLLRPCVKVLFRGNSRLRRPTEVDLTEVSDSGEHIRRVEDILNPEDYGIEPAVHVLEA
jgi:HD-GYP domain-containing protein (c-di-GMP phosphodiesterase class II)